jgi:hypothetical protein
MLDVRCSVPISQAISLGLNRELDAALPPLADVAVILLR